LPEYSFISPFRRIYIALRRLIRLLLKGMQYIYSLTKLRYVDHPVPAFAIIKNDFLRACARAFEWLPLCRI